MTSTGKIRDDRYDWERSRGLISAFGEAKTLTAWSRDGRCAVSREAVRTRLALGWDAEDAIARPKHDKPPLEFTYNGRTLTLRGWAEQSGINYHTLYGRIKLRGMTIADALMKGPDGSDFVVEVSAFGETKALYRWAVDARANCCTRTLRNRLLDGWDPERAITEKPALRNRLGSGEPVTAFGVRMGLEDWARRAHIPSALIRQHMDNHNLTLEQALRSLGWTPHRPEANAAQSDLS
jgi:hypothetical protein